MLMSKILFHIFEINVEYGLQALTYYCPLMPTLVLPIKKINVDYGLEALGCISAH